MNNINNLSYHEKEILSACEKNKVYSASAFSWTKNKKQTLHPNFATLFFEKNPTASSIYQGADLLARNWLFVCPEPILQTLSSFLEDDEAETLLARHEASKSSKNQIKKTRDIEMQQQEELRTFFSLLERSDETALFAQRKKIEQFAHTVTYIELSYMDFDKKKLTLLSELFPNLTTLKLQGCNLDRRNHVLLSQFKQLHHLSLQGCDLGDADVYEITRALPKLVTLNLNHNKLTHRALYEILATCRELQVVNISGCRLEDDSLPLLERLCQRKITVDCSCNEFSDEIITKLKSSPHITIQTLEDLKPTKLTRSKRICASDCMKFY